MENQEGFHSGIGKKQPVRQLRQARTIFGHRGNPFSRLGKMRSLGDARMQRKIRKRRAAASHPVVHRVALN
jgi:hypothetical protein